MIKKPELLAPAGSFEKLQYVLHYGADAVYCAGKRFGLRARADNFDDDALKKAAELTHNFGKKIYVTLNMIPHEEDFKGLAEYIRFLDAIKVDTVLVADPGVFSLVRETAPNMKISVSTQANNTNSRSVAFWRNQGASRIVMARELSRDEIAAICKKKPEGMEIETFVHGAMCISYSGRCLLSHYLTGRDSNRGDCAQPCRWQYYLTESKRPEEHFEIDEDDTGTFIMNSRDLCLARHIPELMKIGVDSFKIEGRMKSSFYAATVTAVYRRIIDETMKNPDFVVPDAWIDELKKVSHRNYTEAFYEGNGTSGDDQNYGTSSYTRYYDFAGVVLDYDDKTGMAVIEQRNKISEGDEIEIFVPGLKDFYFSQKAEGLLDEENRPIDSTPHAKMIYKLKVEQPVPEMALVRKRRDQ